MIIKLEQNANHLATWFPENHMKANKDKCLLVILGTSKEMVNMHAGEVQIEESYNAVIGIALVKKLSFKKHVKTIYKKASQNLY